VYIDSLNIITARHKYNRKVFAAIQNQIEEEELQQHKIISQKQIEELKQHNVKLTEELKQHNIRFGFLEIGQFVQDFKKEVANNIFIGKEVEESRNMNT
jgi:myo-inositol catabolism protein IolC